MNDHDGHVLTALAKVAVYMGMVRKLNDRCIEETPVVDTISFFQPRKLGKPHSLNPYRANGNIRRQQIFSSQHGLGRISQVQCRSSQPPSSLLRQSFSWSQWSPVVPSGLAHFPFPCMGKPRISVLSLEFLLIVHPICCWFTIVLSATETSE